MSGNSDKVQWEQDTAEPNGFIPTLLGIHLLTRQISYLLKKFLYKVGLLPWVGVRMYVKCLTPVMPSVSLPASSLVWTGSPWSC